MNSIIRKTGKKLRSQCGSTLIVTLLFTMLCVFVGGAVLTKEYADMIGADKYGKDALGNFVKLHFANFKRIQVIKHNIQKNYSIQPKSNSI